jgi:hypothetical protein
MTSTMHSTDVGLDAVTHRYEGWLAGLWRGVECAHHRRIDNHFVGADLNER